MRDLGIFGAIVVVAALATAVSVPLWTAFFRRRGWMDDPGPRKIHHRPIPLAGGLAVLTGMASAGLAAGACGWVGMASGTGGLGPGFGPGSGRVGLLIVGAVWLTFLGWWDDRFELAPGAKLAGQVVVAFTVVLMGLRMDAWSAFPEPVQVAMGVLVILTLVNAFNFLDNMNGLCAGLGVVGSLYLAFLAGGQGQFGVVGCALALAGGLIGFLPFNYPRATVFLGDAGSHLVGFWMAGLTMMLAPSSLGSSGPAAGPEWLPFLGSVVPLVDIVQVVLTRWWLGRPIYRGDNNHLSHRLVRAGLTPAVAVSILWVLAALGAGLGLGFALAGARR